MPRLLVLTDRRRSEAAGRPLRETVGRVVGAGAPAILFREKELPPSDRRRLAVEIAEETSAGGAHLVVASDPELAKAVGAVGVHLAARDPVPTPSGLVIGRSCHHMAEVREAAGRVDYVTASPVAPTATKPGYGPPLGVDGLARMVVEAADLPVLALGGVTVGETRRWLRAGAHGVAVLGAVMGADDPEAVVHGFIEELEQEAA